MQDRDNAARLGGSLQRRLLMRTALAGLGGIAGSALVSEEAFAEPATPGSGLAITTNPISAKIPNSTIRVELVPFSTPTPSAAVKPRALLNYLYHDGNGRLFAADSRGPIWQIDRTTGAASLFFDVAAARGANLVTFRAGRVNTVGVRSFAFHPDFARSGQPGFRKFYTATVETPTGPTLPCGTFNVILHSVVAEWTLGDNGLPIPTSRRELLRTAHWHEAHNLDTIIFEPGTGNLLITVGDGGNRNSSPDPFNAGQNLGVALGKVLRINPLQSGAAPYTVPADNPFLGRAGALPEIYAYGLRHPQNLAFDPAGTGIGLLTDIGQARIEEVNILAKGANYGWSSREGTWVTDRRRGGTLYGLPANDASYGFTYPVVQYDHDEGKAIAGGYVYRGTAVPALVGHYIFGDIVNGRIFHVPVSSLVPGSPVEPKRLRLFLGGRPLNLYTLLGSPNLRVDLRFGQDESGEVFVMTKQEGIIYRMRAR